MINEEELRALLEIEGYSREQADEICAQVCAGVLVGDIQAAIEACVALIIQFTDALAAVLPKLVAAAYTHEPKKKHHRPPRYAGPRNKGRSWTPAPPRVARSNCRRYRR